MSYSGGGLGGFGRRTDQTDFTTYDDKQLDELIAAYETNLKNKAGNQRVYTMWLQMANAEKARRAAPTVDSTLANTGAPPAIDLPGMDAAGGLAAMKQKKRAQKNATLIEGQPSKETIAAGPKASLTRRSIVAY